MVRKNFLLGGSTFDMPGALYRLNRRDGSVTGQMQLLALSPTSAFSVMTTCRPACAAKNAAAQPISPAPTIRKSTFRTGCKSLA